MAELSSSVPGSFAPLQLDRVEAHVGQLAPGRRGRQRPGVEPGRLAERSRPDAVHGPDPDGVGGIGAKPIQKEVGLRTGSIDDRGSGINLVVADCLSVGGGTLPGERESVGGGQTKLEQQLGDRNWFFEVVRDPEIQSCAKVVTSLNNSEKGLGNPYTRI